METHEELEADPFRLLRQRKEAQALDLKIQNALAQHIRMDGLSLTITPLGEGGIRFRQAVLTDGSHYASIEFDAAQFAMNEDGYIGYIAEQLVVKFARQQFLAEYQGLTQKARQIAVNKIRPLYPMGDSSFTIHEYGITVFLNDLDGKEQDFLFVSTSELSENGTQRDIQRMAPREFITYRDMLRQQIATLEEDIEEAYNATLRCPPPSHLRRASPADIVMGNVLWHVLDGEWAWCAVEEVLDPHSLSKAYVWQGRRYGRAAAFVEVTTNDPGDAN